jgi:hypothetical protein
MKRNKIVKWDDMLKKLREEIKLIKDKDLKGE